MGRVDPEPPLAIQPRLAGQFVWLSPSSGVFTPVEPARLATEYHLSLRPGLTDAHGRPLRLQAFKHAVGLVGRNGGLELFLFHGVLFLSEQGWQSPVRPDAVASLDHRESVGFNFGG